MISQGAKYAFRALVALAAAGDEGRSLTIPVIAEEQRIPRKFLELILLDLKRRGLLASRRGRDGGYSLLRPADQITFGEVLRAIDGPVAPLPCLSRTAYRRCVDCEGERDCQIRRVFARVAEADRAVLDHTTIADALREPAGPVTDSAV